MSRFSQFRDAIEKNGWEVREIPDDDVPNNFLEMWRLVSLWSPKGKEAFVLFEIDPMPLDINKPTEMDVWNLIVSNTAEVEGSWPKRVYFQHRFSEALIEVVEELGKLRNV
jgi:hypothetical protein